ncbi:MAG: SusC/RagA family TonB-linked outer membrane protein, partial [Reichenbachiella sp.]|uniref:SusC/RagA family TonB-linked outer membrane protein n=1 Tax=Reichenbachiella sp. TaxID=2184521 RepID=UPI0032975B1A
MKKSVLKTLGSVLLLLILIQIASPVQAQSSVVKGRITSSDEGEGLPGVSILEKGTTNGSVTDLDGNYSLSVSSGATLVISYIGYLTQEVAVGSQSEISLALEPDIETLEEIVVIGYGTQKKASLSSAVASVNVDNIQKLPGANVANLLQGQVPGVSANFASGAPGAAPVVRVRGAATIGNNNPLYVIDGIPGDISSINPNDIESINVLKDASAATIYGSRASNGVIVITTKRGQSGAPVVSLNSYVGVSSITKKVDVLDRAGNNSVSAAAYAAEGMSPLSYTQLAGTTDTDWQDEMFRSGLEQKYDVGISGGNEFGTYNFSVGYFDKEGNVIGSGFERYNLRMNSDFKVSDRITIGQTISYARSRRNKIGEDEREDNFGNAGFSPVMDILQSLPHNAVYDPTSANGFAAATVESGNIVGKTEVRTNERTV